MTAAAATDNGQARRDAELRDITAEMLEGVVRNAAIGIQFLETPDIDLHGADYAVRRAAAYLRAAIDALARLKVSKRTEPTHAS
ncbi:hypothetical protein SAMN05519103_01937 [Rhizobiales bacterium GAS113]|nr:hypothetical protein SAMN05519103_01937 [Rhizobiales bacterium GAS113]